MESLVLNPTSMAQWQSLINEATKASGIQLQEDLESYLVFLLMRYIGQPQLVKSILALEFLQASQIGTSQRYTILRDLGDKCLLFSGLFPGCAQRRKVKISYFVKLGKSAYGSLADIKERQLAGLYCTIAQRFVAMMDILHCTREMAHKDGFLTPLQLFELWDETQSQYALQKLAKITDGMPLHCLVSKDDPLN